MKAADVMTLGAVTIRSDATVSEAARLMLQYGISGLPVVDAGGHLVGIVTEGDFLRRTETGTGQHRPRWLEFLLGPGRLAEECTGYIERVWNLDALSGLGIFGIAGGTALCHGLRRVLVRCLRSLHVEGLVATVTQAPACPMGQIGRRSVS
jgi:CBS domain